MKILLATPELDPLTGGSPGGTTARNIAEELQACPDIEFAIALPATTFLLDRLAEEVITATARTTVPGGRIFPVEVDEGPLLYLLDHDDLRAGFPTDAREEGLAHRMVLWGALLLDLATRLRPSIALCHAIGWESSLLPAFIRASSLPIVTAFTNPVSRGRGPSLSMVLQSVRRGGYDHLLPALGRDSRHLQAVDRALADANASDALNDFAVPGHSPPGSNDSLSANSLLAQRRLAQIRLGEEYGLESEPAGALLFIPTRDPAILLPILPRVLETGTRVILVTPLQPAGTEAALIELARRRPRHLARIDPAQQPSTGDLDPLEGADFFLLLPADASDPLPPYTAARASDRHCTTILPSGASPADHSSFAYRGADPEAIWSVLKSAIALHRCPERWRDHHDRLLRTENSTGGLSPRLATLYRDAIKPALTFS